MKGIYVWEQEERAFHSPLDGNKVKGQEVFVVTDTSGDTRLTLDSFSQFIYTCLSRWMSRFLFFIHTMRITGGCLSFHTLPGEKEDDDDSQRVHESFSKSYREEFWDFQFIPRLYSSLLPFQPLVHVGIMDEREEG